MATAVEASSSSSSSGSGSQTEAPRRVSGIEPLGAGAVDARKWLLGLSQPALSEMSGPSRAADAADLLELLKLAQRVELTAASPD
jgi:hypothetical protein